MTPKIHSSTTNYDWFFHALLLELGEELSRKIIT